ncbi:TonB-dependent receptor [Novosphingobium profundi]|uniref:TonB-dependent receptor n=1 Tax=Novosphingobium profundi TaxID=1774954 RepID=UPI001BD91AB2|nr:TonB-dependent receptor [Novosphingobium profundi]MBT0671721.1 TonB-dependent receptor [Novosphingobium profundi]
MRLAMGSSALALAITAPHTAFAQGAGSEAPEKAESAAAGGAIVVTARRREESLLETPVTLSVMTSENLSKLNVNNVLDLQAYTPGLFAQQTASARTDRSRTVLYIRNIKDALNPTVSVFLDGTPVNEDILNNLGSDVARIEVLKGPQSASFGRQSFAGAMNVVTSDPGNDLHFTFDGKFGTYDLYDVRGSIELPIVKDVIALRVSARRFGYGGQYTNSFDGSALGQQSTRTINGTLVIKPADNLKIKAFGMLLEDKDGPGSGAFASQYPSNLFNCNAGGGTPGVNNWFCGKIPLIKAKDIGQNPATPAFASQVVNNSLGIIDPIFTPFTTLPGMERHEMVSNLMVDWTLPGSDITLSSLTGYNKTRNQVNQDLDGRDTSMLPNTTTPAIPGFVGDPYINYPDMVMGSDQNLSQEFRVTSGADQPLRWMVGVNYFKLTNRSYVAGMFPNLVVPFTNGAKNTLVDKSVFGSLSYDLTRELTLNLEGRYIEEQLKTYNRHPETVYDQGKYKRFVPRVSLQYQFDPDFMTYATYSKGMNKGGFNLSVFALTDAQRAWLAEQVDVTNIYKPASLDNYEMGFKGSLFNALTFSAAVFYAKWKDQAISNSIAVPNSVAGASDVVVSVTQNTGRSTVKGAEIEGNLRATDNLSFDFNAGYSKVTLDTEIPCASCVAISGNSTVAAGSINPAGPLFSSNLGAEYGFDVDDDYRWYIRADYAHRSRVYLTYENIAWIGDQNTVNLRTGLTSKSLSVQLYVDNVFDNRTYGAAQATTSLLGGNGVALSMPIKREGGIRLQFGF